MKWLSLYVWFCLSLSLRHTMSFFPCGCSSGNILERYTLHGGLAMIQHPCAHPAMHRQTHMAAFYGFVLG